MPPGLPVVHCHPTSLAMPRRLMPDQLNTLDVVPFLSAP